jgi:hypothetical protein
VTLGRSEIASLVLAAVAVASAALVFATRNAPTTAETSERSNHVLPVWRKDEIGRIALEIGKERLEIERAGDAWNLTLPVREPADAAAVDRLLDGIGFATVSRRVTSEDRARHGTATPRARLVLGAGERSYTLSLGAETPTPAGAAYVEVADPSGSRTVSVVTREVAALLLTPPDDFRRHALVGFGTRELGALEIEGAHGKLRLVRGKGVGFLLDGKERADRDRSEPLLAAVSGLSATRFLELAAAERARAGTPALSVRLFRRNSAEKPEILEIGGPCPNQPDEVVAIARAPFARAACVKREAAAPLLLMAPALRATAPFSARKDEVETLLLERGGRSLVMTRRGNGFRLQKPSEADIDLEAGNQRLEAILRAPAELVANPAPKELGLEPPSGRAVLTVIGDDDKASEETLELGAVKPDGTLYVRRAEDGVVLAVNRDAARAFQVDSTLLRSRKILDFALSALAELELDVPEHQLLRRSPNGFELALPRGFEHDGELATQAVLALGSLTAQRFVADEDDGSFGFEKPLLTARFRVDAGDAGTNDGKLVVGRAAPGGYFAKLTSAPGVFLIERAVVERLSVLFVNRGVFLGDPKLLARLRFESAGKQVVLERRAGELVPAAGSGLDAAALAPALEALAALRAEAAVHTGPARANEGFVAPALTVTLEPSPGLGPPRSFRIGKSDSFLDQSVRYARADGTDATFVIAESKLRPMFDLF